MATGMIVLEDGCVHLFISVRDELIYRLKTDRPMFPPTI